MFKKILIGTLAAVIIVAAGASAFTALAAPTADSAPAVSVPNVSAAPVAVGSVNAVQSSVSVQAAAAPSADETAGLLYMYEEEKLARDVYNALYALWGQTTFQSIAASEQTHMDAINTILVRYGIATPSAAAGTYSNASLQSLYNTLMSTGSQSLADALKVGATIEEVDITDLQSRLDQTGNADIQLVYSNLMNGSFNHLRSYVSVLERQTGEVYQPQYLSADLYQSILAGGNGNGQSAGASGSAGQGQGQGAGVGTGTTTSSGRSGRGYHGGG